MRPRVLTVLLGLLAIAALPRESVAQRLDLRLSSAVITFPSADPDLMPVVTAPPVQITYRVRQNNGPWTLTILAGGDLISGGATVDISNISWVATPAPPFQAGTLSKSVAQTLASGNGNANPAATGSITFRVTNSWNYIAGVYTQTVVFTLSAP
jgi:hypothetical protein